MALSTTNNTVKLSDGTILPLFGLGTSTNKSKEEITNLLRAAFDLGYRHIDTAINYNV